MLRATLSALWLTTCAQAFAADAASELPSPQAPPAQAQTPSPDAKAEFAQTYKTFRQLNDAGKHEEALPYAERAYRLGLQIYGEQHRNSAALALNLGETYDMTGRRRDAVKTLDKAIELYRLVYGTASRELVDPLMARANATGAWDAKARADLYQQALGIARKHVGADDLLLAQLNLEAGIHLLRDGNVRESNAFLTAAYRQYRKQLPPTDPRLLIAAFWSGKYQLAVARPRAAEPYFDQVLAALGDDAANPLVRASHALLVTVYEQLGESAKATPHCVAVGRLEPWTDTASRTPLFRSDPQYPAEAKGREGYAAIEFTIDAAGFVRDAKLVEAHGSDSFAEPGLAAIRTWRYAPRFAGDAPVDTPGVQAQVEFKLTP